MQFKKKNNNVVVKTGEYLATFSLPKIYLKKDKCWWS